MNEDLDEIQNIEKKQLLEKFVYKNNDLEELKSITNQFNIFASLGVVRQELRHSNFLSWILNPFETHNLGDYFLSSFLKMAAFNKSEDKIIDLDLLDIDALDFSDASVLVEWQKIDILMVDDTNKVLCVIENKIDTKEHSNQLTRYREKVEANYPNYKKLFIYLTINGEEPENNPEYLSVGYKQISNLIDTLLKSKGTQLNNEVVLFIKHYNEMIKRYIMEDSEIQRLCENLYKKHKPALDLLFKYKPDIYMHIKDVLVEIIDENDTLDKDHCSKAYIRFIPKEIDFLPRKGEKWTPTKRILLFEIESSANSVDIKFLIGPGDQSIRTIIHEHTNDKKIYKKTKLYDQWTNIYKFNLAKISKLEDLDKAGLKETLKAGMDKFLNGDWLKLKEDLLLLKAEKFENTESYQNN